MSQQLELEMQRSARDGEAQRQGALLERLAKAEEVVSVAHDTLTFRSPP
eukprot:COSAG01_NODE_6156_length_3819_cov_601.257796_3_plen_49_part_00